jgi:hypothetical protein
VEKPFSYSDRVGWRGLGVRGLCPARRLLTVTVSDCGVATFIFSQNMFHLLSNRVYPQQRFEHAHSAKLHYPKRRSKGRREPAGAGVGIARYLNTHDSYDGLVLTKHAWRYARPHRSAGTVRECGEWQRMVSTTCPFFNVSPESRAKSPAFTGCPHPRCGYALMGTDIGDEVKDALHGPEGVVQ